MTKEEPDLTSGGTQEQGGSSGVPVSYGTNREDVPNKSSPTAEMEENPKNQNRSSNKDSSGESKKITKALSESTTPLVGLKKEVGLMDGVGIIVGIIIGAGIFVGPGSVVRYTGSVGMSLIVWSITGLLCMCGAFCYAEMGTMIPKSGGDYAYILEAFGPVPAFLSLWVEFFLSSPGSKAIVSITFANYLLQPFFPNCHKAPYLAVRFVAIALLGFITYINCVGVKLSTRLQDALTMTKVFALIVITIAGITHLAQGNVENYTNAMEGTNYELSSIFTAFFPTIFAFGGWNALNNLMEELKNPYKNLPLAICISLIIVTVVYVLTNVAYFAVLTPYEVMSSNAVALTFGHRTLGVFAWIISVFVALSTFGHLNGGALAQSRVVFAASRAGHLPKCLRLIHVRNNTPVVSLISIVILPCFMIFVPDVGSILAYTTFMGSLVNLMSISSLLWLRYKEPDRSRPIKVWLGFPIIYLVICLCICVFPIIQRPVEIGVGVAAYLVGILVYYLAIHRKNEVLGAALDKLTYWCQMVFECVEEEKQE